MLMCAPINTTEMMFLVVISVQLLHAILVGVALVRQGNLALRMHNQSADLHGIHRAQTQLADALRILVDKVR